MFIFSTIIISRKQKNHKNKRETRNSIVILVITTKCSINYSQSWAEIR